MTAMKTKRTKIHSDSFSNENVLSAYLKEINQVPLLSREEEDQTAREAAKGNKQARDRLINANLRFVVNVAKKYQG
ncbi:MAG: RNA polymerase subunit sigma, partial [Treponema sp.]|nr:RNA polymerase subunit sigma [Treponema sp.]